MFIIALEGIDGSGKTTQCRLLSNYLTEHGIKARPIGRRFILYTLLALTAQTNVIIADRYIYTIKIYLQHKKVSDKIINMLLKHLPSPNLVFYLQTNIEIAQKRIEQRGKKLGKYEDKKGLEIFLQGFEKEFCKEQINIHKLNSTQPTNQIHEKITNIATAAIKDFFVSENTISKNTSN